MANIVIEATDITDALNQINQRLETGVVKAVERGAQVALAAMQRQADETYKRPVPTNSQVRAAKKQIASGKKVRVKGGKKAIGEGGKPAWKRTGNLKAQLRIKRPSALVREIGPEGSSEAYFEHLANLPDGALGINRSNDIKGKAQKVTESQIEAVVQQELINALGS